MQKGALAYDVKRNFKIARKKQMCSVDASDAQTFVWTVGERARWLYDFEVTERRRENVSRVVFFLDKVMDDSESYVGNGTHQSKGRRSGRDLVYIFNLCVFISLLCCYSVLLFTVVVVRTVSNVSELRLRCGVQIRFCLDCYQLFDRLSLNVG